MFLNSQNPDIKIRKDKWKRTTKYIIKNLNWTKEKLYALYSAVSPIPPITPATPSPQLLPANIG